MCSLPWVEGGVIGPHVSELRCSAIWCEWCAEECGRGVRRACAHDAQLMGGGATCRLVGSLCSVPFLAIRWSALGGVSFKAMCHSYVLAVFRVACLGVCGLGSWEWLVCGALVVAGLRLGSSRGFIAVLCGAWCGWLAVFLCFCCAWLTVWVLFERFWLWTWLSSVAGSMRMHVAWGTILLC